MEKSTDYATLLSYTYSEQDAVLSQSENGFTFLIRNPERADGNIEIAVNGGTFTVAFVSMEEDFGEDFGEVVAFVDELLADETVIFELMSQGEYVLGGSRSVKEIGKYRSPLAMAEGLAGGDPELRKGILSCMKEGNCAVRVRGFCANRCFSVILAK